ncbi:MAG: hypothetical protein CMD99_09780 [Gammaproteobacteria bacterium]|nr:hypothetical protein [Gammaproteobacteria bacterium]
MPRSMPKWQVFVAQVGHYGLYFLMCALMLTGIISANFAFDSIMVLGLFDLAFANHDASLFAIVRSIHEFCTQVIIVLIAIQILAAIYHQFVAKDDTTRNMARFWITKRLKSPFMLRVITEWCSVTHDLYLSFY